MPAAIDGQKISAITTAATSVVAVSPGRVSMIEASKRCGGTMTSTCSSDAGGAGVSGAAPCASLSNWARSVSASWALMYASRPEPLVDAMRRRNSARPKMRASVGRTTSIA